MYTVSQIQTDRQRDTELRKRMKKEKGREETA